MKRLLDVVGSYWCRLAHAEAMWPVQGYYRCRVCLRTHPVPWEGRENARRQRAGVVAGPALAVPPR